jgi:hypothetical protein
MSFVKFSNIQLTYWAMTIPTGLFSHYCSSCYCQPFDVTFLQSLSHYPYPIPTLNPSATYLSWGRYSSRGAMDRLINYPLSDEVVNFDSRLPQHPIYK